MDYLKRTFHIITRNVFTAPKQQENYIEVSRLDAYLNYVHKILVWEDPSLSWTTLGALNFLFWLIVYLELRLYGIIFLTILILFVTDLYFEQCGLKANRTPSSDAVREVMNFITDVILYLKVLRKDNASVFCGIMCAVFLGLSFIARTINGYLFAYIGFLSLFFGPLIFAKIPAEYVKQIKRGLRSISTTEGMLAEKELLPFLTEKDDDADSFVSEKTADSVTNSLISGISTMPSYLDAESSMDGLDEEDLELTQPMKHTSSFAKAIGEYSSDSDSEHRNMEFESGHFKRDSSSDEENVYSAGLDFSDAVDGADVAVKSAPAANLAQSIGVGILTNLSAVGSNILTNVMNSVTKSQNRRDSDSDFEIINSDDLNEET